MPPARPLSAPAPHASRLCETGEDLRPYVAALSPLRCTAAAVAAHVAPVECSWAAEPRSRHCEACGAQWIRLRPPGCHVATNLIAAIRALKLAHNKRLVSRQWDEAHAHFVWTRTPAGDAWLAR